ncbi:hypothetical protein Tco_1446764 [Tanacetum coccineum]
MLDWKPLCHKGRNLLSYHRCHQELYMATRHLPFLLKSLKYSSTPLRRSKAQTPMIQRVDFAKVPDDETTLTFLIDLGYKGPLYKHLSMENVNYPKLIWEDFAFQIDHRQMKKGRRKNMPYLRIGEDFQEYGLPIPETMLTEGIKQSESYQMVIKYSTGLIPPKNNRRKGSHGKKTADTPEATVDVSKIVALELGKSTSLTEAVEEEATRQVHATHARIVTESVLEPAKRRPLGIAFRDTSSVSKKMSPDPSQKLKGIQTLTLEEQLAADTMQALKESKKTSRRQPGTGGSSEGTSVSLGVLDESTIVPSTSSEGTESEYSKEDDDDENIEWVDTVKEEEKDDDDDDDKRINLEKTDDEETDDEFVHREEHVQDDDEETDDEFVHGNEQVKDDEDEEMINAEDVDTGNGDEEITDAAKADAEKTEEVKDDIKNVELPPTSSSLFVSLGFEIPHIQSPYVLIVPVSMIFEPLLLTPIPKTPLVAHATTLLPPPFVSTISPVLLQSTTPILTPPITIEALFVTTIQDPLHVVIQIVYVLEKDVQELKEADNTTTLRASLKPEIPSAVNAFLGSSLRDALQKVLQKHTKELIQKYLHMVKNALEKTSLPVAQSSSQAPFSLKAAESLSEYELKTILFDKIDKNPGKVLRKRDRDDEDPSAGPNQGKSPVKTFKFGKFVTVEEPVE